MKKEGSGMVLQQDFGFLYKQVDELEVAQQAFAANFFAFGQAADGTVERAFGTRQYVEDDVLQVGHFSSFRLLRKIGKNY